MKHLFRKVAIAFVSATVIAGASVPAGAMPIAVAPAAKVAVQSDVTSVQYREYRRDHYRGYRGYRDRRPHHRYRDGYWYPLAAFGAGAIIGGAMAAPPRPRYYEHPRYYERPRYYAPAPAPVYRAAGELNPRHRDWCHARYRSYDAYSNTFQPYHGPRQSCHSPYY